MNTLILITTKGCESCSIMHGLVRSAIELSDCDVNFEVNDREYFESEIADYNVTDFPTLLFFKDNKYIKKEVGTSPVRTIQKWFNVFS